MTTTLNLLSNNAEDATLIFTGPQAIPGFQEGPRLRWNRRRGVHGHPHGWRRHRCTVRPVPARTSPGGDAAGRHAQRFRIPSSRQLLAAVRHSTNGSRRRAEFCPGARSVDGPVPSHAAQGPRQRDRTPQAKNDHSRSGAGA